VKTVARGKLVFRNGVIVDEATGERVGLPEHTE
jgi:hypothetical protein